MTAPPPGFPSVVDPELVVHLFVAASGPDADRGYHRLTEIWADCRRLARLDAPLPTRVGLSIPLELPPGRPPAGEDEVVLAGRQRDSTEVVQAVLRRRHDVFCLSTVFTVSKAGDDAWAELDALWDSVAGEVPPPGLLGVARVYQGCMTDKPGAAAVISAMTDRLGAVLTTADGLSAWDLGGADDRTDRRIVVLAPAGANHRLSDWTWSDGGLYLPPLGRYLLTASKIRFELRIRAGSPPRRYGADLNDAARTFSALAARPTRESDLTALATAREQVRVRASEVIDIQVSLREMIRTVEIALDNLRVAAAAGGAPVFTEDERIARWLLQLLADDEFYLEAACDRATRLTEDVGPVIGQAGGTWPVDGEILAPRTDVVLTDSKRAAFAQELATVFGLGLEADHLLDRAGYPRKSRVSAPGASVDTVWREILRHMSNGVVEQPMRRLLVAALEIVPYNEVFRILLTARDVGGPTHGDR